jgi:hypothetical protein
MEPLLFGIHADVVGEALGAIVVLSLIIERALAPVFEWRPILKALDKKGLKEPIAVIVSVVVVVFVELDAIAVIFSQENNSWIGFLITGLVVAGGSKGSVKLFRDYLGWKSTARKELEADRKAAGQP